MSSRSARSSWRWTEMDDLQAEFKNEMGNDYCGDVMFGEPLLKHTSLAIGGPADMYVIPSEAISLKRCLMFAMSRKMPVHVLGGGSNVIMSDRGFKGVVISLKYFNMIKMVNDRNGSVELFVEVGVPLQRLINFCVENGYAGIEGLSGIPGTVGGAIVGNAGSFGQEMKDVVESLVVSNHSGMIKRLSSGEFSFAYRAALIEKGLIVLSANMIFDKSEPAGLKAKVADYLSKKKSSQPLSERSAGCVYKNPEGAFAGRLIETAGCKGMRVGDMEVSEVHANYFINTGKGTAADFIELMKKVKAKVEESSGIRLEPEVRIIGNGI
jgi:UDP-N-acetylmuramate dehydrogenase